MKWKVFHTTLSVSKWRWFEMCLTLDQSMADLEWLITCPLSTSSVYVSPSVCPSVGQGEPLGDVGNHWSAVLVMNDRLMCILLPCTRLLPADLSVDHMFAVTASLISWRHLLSSKHRRRHFNDRIILDLWTLVAARVEFACWLGASYTSPQSYSLHNCFCGYTSRWKIRLSV